jgi:hypothetical protein
MKMRSILCSDWDRHISSQASIFLYSLKFGHVISNFIHGFDTCNRKLVISVYSFCSDSVRLCPVGQFQFALVFKFTVSSRLQFPMTFAYILKENEHSFMFHVL